MSDSQSAVDAEAREQAYVRFRELGFGKPASLLLAAALNPPWKILIESPHVSEDLLQAVKTSAETGNYRVGELTAQESWEQAVSRAYETLEAYVRAGIEREEWGILGFCSTWTGFWHKMGGGPVHRSAPWVEVDGESLMSPDLLFDDEWLGTDIDFDGLIEVEHRAIENSVEHFSDPRKQQALLAKLRESDDFFESLSPIPDEWNPRVEWFEYWLDQGLEADAAWLVSAAANPPVWLISQSPRNYRRDLDLAFRRFRKTGTRLAEKGKIEKIIKQAIKALHDYFAIARRYGDQGMAALFVFNISVYEEMVSQQLVTPGQKFDKQRISELISLEMGVHAHATRRPADFNLP